MREYLDWDVLIKSSLDQEPQNITQHIDVEGLVVAGMGGSGIVGDVLYVESLSRFKKPLIVVKDFKLPKYVSKQWLLLAISYSGNTTETLEIVRKAFEKGVKIGVVTSGGTLLKIAVEKKLPYFKVPSGRTPRTSFPTLLIGALKLLRSLGIDTYVLSYDIINKLMRKEELLKVASEIASFVGSNIPVFISDNDYYPLALRAKDEFNENAKVIGKVEVYPEGFHNDIVGWEIPKEGLTALIFRKSNDKAMDFLIKYLTESLVNTYVITLDDELIPNIIKWSQALGVASVTHALQRSVNPKETKSIQRYKEFIEREWRIHFNKDV